MSKLKRIKKPKTPNSCNNCVNLKSRSYMTSPYSGGVDYWCDKTGKELSSPQDTICDDWAKSKGER